MRRQELQRMWCDGFIPDTFVVTPGGSHVAGRVWIGNGSGGQSLWKFVLLLGRARVERAEVNWETFLPPEDTTGWLYLDFEHQFLKIKLSAARSDGATSAR